MNSQQGQLGQNDPRIDIRRVAFDSGQWAAESTSSFSSLPILLQGGHGQWIAASPSLTR